MEVAARKALLEAIKKRFGDRHEEHEDSGRGAEGPLAVVRPVDVQEIEYLAKETARYSVPLVPLGAGTAYAAGTEKGSVLIRFDLMRGSWIEVGEEVRVKAEPGASLLELDDNLHIGGRGLTVYPTSAPVATVGGWLVQDGIGVGSFEYGRTSENVLSADVVLPGDGFRTLRGEDLRSVLEPAGTAGVVVGATLRTRRADGDLPFGALFDAPEDLIETLMEIFDARIPLWHLAFASSGIVRAEDLGGNYLLFGAYPAERGANVEEALRGTVYSRGGRTLAAADAYRVWGDRFSPVTPSRPTPIVERSFVSLTELATVLPDMPSLPEDVVRGTVSRSGEVLLLTLEASGESRGCHH